MKGFGKALMDMIRVSMNRTIARKISSGVTTLALAGVVLLLAAGCASAGEQGGTGCVNSTGWAYQCGDTVTESCVFNGDMNCTGTHGLIIGANDIIINGNYFKMAGNRESITCGGSQTIAAQHSGIINTDYDNITITNLEIDNFCTGIALGDNAAVVDNNIITGCEIHDCGDSDSTTHGIHMIGTNNCTISSNEIYNIDGTGPQSGCGGGGNGIFMFGVEEDRGNHNNIIHNNFTNNVKSGFFMKMMCMHNNISYNNATGHGQGGIVLMCIKSNFNIIEGNDAFENDFYGFFIGGNNNTIRYNKITNNGYYGIEFGRSDGSCDNELFNNTICGNDCTDIRVVSGVTGNHGDNNTCDITLNYDDNGTTGCTLFCSGTSIISDFSADPTMGAEPLSVNFTDQSNAKQGIDSWSWDFNDDGIVDNITQNPVYMYSTLYPYSYYNVSLTVNGTGGDSASETKTEYMRVWRPDAAPNADFYCEPGVGDHTIPVTFTDTSLGEITSWSWDFDNDGIVDNTTQNPVYQYSANGIYNISLKVSGPGGLSKDIKFYCIRIGTEGAAKRPLIDAHFFADKRTGSAPFTVKFTDMSRSQGEIISWNWDFGDGNTSNERNPEHTYESPGIYNVGLETTLTTGATTSETKIDYIIVSTVVPTPFVISGRINCTNGDPVNDPDVTIANLNRNEILPVETYAASNYYRVLTSSDNVSEGNVLHFNVIGSSNPIDFNQTITADEIEAGGFVRNITVDCGFTGICGDVTCNGVVDTGDVILLSNYVGYYPGMPQYALNSTQQWAGDVTGNNVIDTGDVILLSNYVGYSGYELNCTCM